MIFLCEGLIEPDDAAALRDRVRPHLQHYDLPDRGRYLVDETHVEAALFARLEALAAERLGRPVARAGARWTRFARGDYALFKDDAFRWRALRHHAEVCMDFSAEGSDEGQIVYTGAGGGGVMPQRPGAGAVVDRRSPIYRYERYLGVRYGAGEVFRLGLVLNV